jgi:hypothetical protein
MSGQAQRDGDLPLTFHKAGVRTVVPLGYTTPNSMLRCTGIVTRRCDFARRVLEGDQSGPLLTVCFGSEADCRLRAESGRWMLE